MPPPRRHVADHARSAEPNVTFVAAARVDEAIEILRPLVQAVGATIGPHCEVVLHDLRSLESSIVAISNGGVTGRRVGGPIVGGPKEDVALRLLDSAVRESALSVGYKTRTGDGRELRSTSLVLRTPDGKPAIAFCINLDLSTITMAQMLLERIAKTSTPDGAAIGDDSPHAEVAEIVSRMIQDALSEVGRPPEFMGREERLTAVRLMHERGLFLIKGGVERAADALSISRFTLYGYLKEVRDAYRAGVGRTGRVWETRASGRRTR